MEREEKSRMEKMKHDRASLGVDDLRLHVGSVGAVAAEGRDGDVHRDDDVLDMNSMAGVPLLSKNRMERKRKMVKNRYLEYAMSRSGTRLSDQYRKTADLTIEVTFLHMMSRSLRRRLSGTYEGDKPWTTLWVFLIILLVFGAFAPSFTTNGHFEFNLNINLRDLGFFSLASLVIAGFLVYSLTRVVVIVRWALYWLLLIEAILYFWKREYNLFGKKAPSILLIALGVLEFLTFSIYAFIHFGYVPLVTSEFFRQWVGAKNWWKIRKIGPWTFTYRSGFFSPNRTTCSYRGETNEHGLPHGYGHWMDDSFHGEILTGWWENGIPVGPFRSREYGSGSAFDKVIIGFVHASDDEFTERSYFPSQNKPPRIGSASIECSVSGSFFSNLPDATIFHGPFTMVPGAATVDLGNDRPDSFATSATVAQCLQRIRYLSSKHPLSNVIVTASALRGVSVAGHIYNPTGDLYSKSCDRIVIQVIYPKPAPQTRMAAYKQEEQELLVDRNRKTQLVISNEVNDGENARNVTSTPSLRSSLYLADSDNEREMYDDRAEDFLDLEDDISLSLEMENGTDSEEGGRQEREHARVRYGTCSESDAKTASEHMKSSYLPLNTENHVVQHGLENSHGYDFQPFNLGSSMHDPHLRVENWSSSLDGHTQALVFFPGFNASLRNSLRRMGQFMAMAHFPPYIKPFVFSWPCARVATYLWAIDSAAAVRTRKALKTFFQGLLDAGIRDVHLLSHSMGVQALMAAFADQPDGSPSEIAELFDTVEWQDPSFSTSTTSTSPPSSTASSPDVSANRPNKLLLRARTITLLNPDYPLAAFVSHGFYTIRRICSHITVVGNRRDNVLHIAEMGNGIMRTIHHYLDYNPLPPHLVVPVQPEDSRIYGCNEDQDSCCCTIGGLCSQQTTQDEIQGRDRLWSKQLAMGKQIFSLFAPSQVIDTTSVSQRKRKQRQLRRWLDLDAIDTTWMDSNVHALRHNYFNLNPVLLEDLRELIVTGKRASERSLLLHREGNVFSYCQAPACVVNE